MKQFIRNFKKQKAISLLNICSLSLGIMVSIIVGLWAINELSFDKFHKNNDRIYRLVGHFEINGQPIKLGSTFRPFGEQAKEKLPEVEDMCRVVQENDAIVKANQAVHKVSKVFITDSNFFSFFNFKLKEGAITDVLSSTDRVVISQSAAIRYFQKQNAIGQIVSYLGRDFQVSGVMEDMPKNSSLQADIVFPLFGSYAKKGWGDSDMYATYFLFQKNANIDAITASLNSIAGEGFPMMKNIGAQFTVESIRDMHFSQGFTFETMVKGNKSLTMVFIITALIILIISCINFTNLFISTSFIRAKTVGIKKSQGAKTGSLVAEIYGETSVYVLLAIALGVFLASFAFPVFNNFTQSSLSIDYSSPPLYLFLAVLFVFTVLLAGSFPALYITRFNVIETLFGKFRGKKVSFFQKSLVIMQFASSIALLIVVAFMQKQVGYMISHDLGFNKENVLYVQGGDNFGWDNYKMLHDEFLKEPSIVDVTRAKAIPSNWANGNPISTIGSEKNHLMEICAIAPNYFDFFDMKIVAGENPFFLESADTAGYIVLNECAVKTLGLENPVGTVLTHGFTIKGVVKDAHTKSFHKDVEPQVYTPIMWKEWYPIMFKISGNPQKAIDVIEKKWKELEPENPFEYHFLDDTYEKLYTAETNAGKVLAFAMLITIVITIAGLFAMAYYATQRRIREIALRKVNGATLKDLLLLLNKEFVVWLSISFILAIPIAYFGLSSWLKEFVVKTPLSAWVFILVGLVALLVTLFTTSYQTWKTATTNPVNALKNE